MHSNHTKQINFGLHWHCQSNIKQLAVDILSSSLVNQWIQHRKGACTRRNAAKYIKHRNGQLTFATAGGRYMARVFYFARVRNFSGDTDNADVISSCVHSYSQSAHTHSRVLKRDRWGPSDCLIYSSPFFSASEQNAPLRCPRLSWSR